MMVLVSKGSLTPTEKYPISVLCSNVIHFDSLRYLYHSNLTGVNVNWTLRKNITTIKITQANRVIPEIKLEYKSN
jgi:hypothetical protein